MPKPIFKPLRFIGEPIEVAFHPAPLYKKRPPCPDGFTWGKKTHTVSECLSEWQDFSRRGRMAHNMRPDHAEAASRKGSWGVGRTYFRVRTGGGQVFDLYYDRAPTGGSGREGGWYLYRELSEEPEEEPE